MTETSQHRKKDISKTKQHCSFLVNGMRDGLPIGIGYLAVAFSLGIAASNAGFSWLQGFVISFFCSASAGEYAAFALIAADTGYLEVAVMTVIANARYLLMSCALSQKIRPETSLFHRLAMGFSVTDEIFGAAIGQNGWLSLEYYAGLVIGAVPLWAIGTALGIIMGEILPARLVIALGVSLYGMFLAVIIPAARRDKVVLVLIVVSFSASYFMSRSSFFSFLSEGTRTILLTVILSSAAALLFPHKEAVEHDT